MHELIDDVTIPFLTVGSTLNWFLRLAIQFWNWQHCFRKLSTQNVLLPLTIIDVFLYRRELTPEVFDLATLFSNIKCKKCVVAIIKNQKLWS